MAQTSSSSSSDGDRARQVGRLGCLAVRGDQTVESRRADEHFVPASVHKLAVTAAALHHLGPKLQISTRLWAGGKLSAAGELKTLVVEAAGDPTWSRRFFDRGADQPLAELARQLAAAGVRNVSGDVVVDVSRFPGRPVPSSRALGDLAFAFAAPTAALAVDDNVIDLRMAPGKFVGEPASFVADAPIVNLTRTAPAARHEKGTVDFLAVWSDASWVIRGEYPITEPPYRIELAAADGELRALRRLIAHLESAGIEVSGSPRLSATQVARHGERPLAEIHSPPLAEWLPAILEDSSNWHAEMLLRLLAAQVTGEGRLDEGLRVVEELLEQVVEIAPGATALDDASGISPFNLWTPRTVVSLLSWSWHQPWRQVFVDALARPGRGTLKAWPRLPSTVVAKTGTARHTDALAGYLLAGSGPGSEPPVAFACLVNQNLATHDAGRRRIAKAVSRFLGH